MPKGLSIHIGINARPQDCCSTGTLLGAEQDARDMARIAGHHDFRVIVPPAGPATLVWLLPELRKAATDLVKGDILLLTFSGHGCRAPKGVGVTDRYSDSWCLADGKLTDRDLYTELAEFDAGVRVVVVSDSCHSGSVLGGFAKSSQEEFRAKWDAWWEWLRVRMPTDKGDRLAPEALELLRVPLRPSEKSIRANVLILAASRGDQSAQDGERNGLFTAMLLKAWDNGRFEGTYSDLIWKVFDLVTSRCRWQAPGWTCDGTCDQSLVNERAFSI